MYHSRYFLLLCLTAATAACEPGSVQETLGIDRKAPDEFKVISRPPLSVPPQFNLRPPSATAQPPNETPTDQQARSLVLGTASSTATSTANVFTLKEGSADTAVAPVAVTPTTPELPAGSVAENQFLRNAGADKVDPNVRNTLVEEKITVQEEEEEKAWWEMWSTNPPKKDPLVNANKESERIQTNQKEGKPVNDGETPEVKPKDRGVLGRILGD